MIALPSFLAALDKPQARPVAGEGEARETTEIAANDGFAALIAQLIQILPAAAAQDGESGEPADYQTGNPASGKILPVEGLELAAAPLAPAASDALLGAEAIPASTFAVTSSATILSFQQAQIMQAAKRGEPIAQAAAEPAAAQPTTREAQVVQPALRADQIRMTVSAAPADAATPGAAASQNATAPVERQLAQALGAQSGDPKQSGRDPQGQTSSLAERFQPARTAVPEKDFAAGDRSAPAETATAAGRATASADAGKLGALPVAAALEPVATSRVEAARIAPAPTASPVSTVENIERLVERLSVAREFDMTKSASIAVSHREFGALTVTFDNARTGLDVEIAAKDTDMQRALAAAVAADRPASRAGEPLQQQSSHTSAAGTERGAGSAGQGATSSGTGSEGDRSQNQRGRSLSLPPQDARNSTASSAGDDALYA